MHSVQVSLPDVARRSESGFLKRSLFRMKTPLSSAAEIKALASYIADKQTSFARARSS
jgi:hypothetical protein